MKIEVFSVIIIVIQLWEVTKKSERSLGIKDNIC